MCGTKGIHRSRLCLQVWTPSSMFFSLGLWLEYNIYTNASAMASPYFLAFSYDITIPGGGEKTKETAQNIFGLKKVLKADKFKTGGLLVGSHSIRKFAATHVRRFGISRDDMEGRGRWKGQGRVSDCYDDLELPYYPDCKAAEALCMGGACYYVINNAICNFMKPWEPMGRMIPFKRGPDSRKVVNTASSSL